MGKIPSGPEDLFVLRRFRTLFTTLSLKWTRFIVHPTFGILGSAWSVVSNLEFSAKSLAKRFALDFASVIRLPLQSTSAGEEDFIKFLLTPFAKDQKDFGVRYVLRSLFFIFWS